MKQNTNTANQAMITTAPAIDPRIITLQGSFWKGHMTPEAARGEWLAQKVRQRQYLASLGVKL
jgi:hypothetical protein